MDRVAPTAGGLTSRHWTARAGRFDGAASHLRHWDAWLGLFRAALGAAPLRLLDLGCTGACASRRRLWAIA